MKCCRRLTFLTSDPDPLKKFYICKKETKTYSCQTSSFLYINTNALGPAVHSGKNAVKKSPLGDIPDLRCTLKIRTLDTPIRILLAAPTWSYIFGMVRLKKNTQNLAIKYWINNFWPNLFDQNRVYFVRKCVRNIWPHLSAARCQNWGLDKSFLLFNFGCHRFCCQEF